MLSTAVYPRLQGYWEMSHVTEFSWELGPNVPPTKNWEVCGFGPLFLVVAKYCVQKSNIERERGDLRSEQDFYWRNSPVKLKG